MSRASAADKPSEPACVCGGGYGFYTELDEHDEPTGREIYCTCPKGIALEAKEAGRHKDDKQ